MMESSHPPHMVLSLGKIFLPYPRSLEPCETPPHPTCKTLLLINLATTIAIVFNKTCFINKNILEIKNKFIPSN